MKTGPLQSANGTLASQFLELFLINEREKINLPLNRICGVGHFENELFTRARGRGWERVQIRKFLET